MNIYQGKITCQGIEHVFKICYVTLCCSCIFILRYEDACALNYVMLRCVTEGKVNMYEYDTMYVFTLK